MRGALAFPADPVALGEAVDLDDGFKRLVLYLHARCSEIDHYEMLGVQMSTPRKEIRRAFLRRTKLFHPDRYFRRELGSYASRLNDLYKAISRAYDVLSDPQKRERYGLKLKQVRGPIREHQH